jgi:A/G-specific adenine glycosylase
MLQQTQAQRVIPKWETFCAAYPTPGACAAAPLGDVLRLWQGLGYPRRARDLQLAARRIATVHGGEVPHEIGELLALPGIGPYTARAVLAFAYERDVAVVDTNVARVLARTVGERLTTSGAQRLADGYVPAGRGWAWNQALLDLGASVCRPTPRCDQCPLAATCAWNRAGRSQPDPAIGSAGVSTRQAPYAGSDRQARGELLRALASGPVQRAGYRDDIVGSLVDDGLVVERAGTLTLP